MTTETLPSMTLPAEPTTTPTVDAGATPTQTFADLGAHPRAVERLAELGIETPTLIQARAIPPLLAGRDVVGQSRTGSGKTIAYGLPLIERMDPRLRRVQALVLVPTRELAGQVAGVLFSLGAGRGLRVAQLIGGRSYTPQREALRMGAQIAVGAPGRVLDHLRQGALDLSQLTFAVLDEADQMLDAGFAPDVERLLAAMPERRQLALFTATLPAMTTQIAQRYLHDPISVDAGTPESRPAPTITQTVYVAPRDQRLAALMALLNRRRDASGTTLVFGRTKHGVDKLARQLIARGYPVAALHGNMSQNARDRVMVDFRSGKTPMLLATNVAARGLDVLSIDQVINYELPESAELFTHRVGRTGRMDNEGEAITLLTPDDMAQWRRFQRDLALKVKPQPFPQSELPAASAPATPAVASVSEVAPTQPTEPAAAPARSERYGERRAARRPFAENARPMRRGDATERWSRSTSVNERRDDYRAGARNDFRNDPRGDDRRESRFESRFERGDDERRDDRRERTDRFERAPRRTEYRRDDARSSERDERGERPARPYRAPSRPASGFRSSEGGASHRPGRPAAGRAGRPVRAERGERGSRLTRG